MKKGILLGTVLLFTVVLFSACSQEEKEKPETTGQETATEKVESDIVRTGIIDVASIDENGDGKVFQDPMDWNVISDEAGKCPLCEMTLKEVSIDEAKQNLEKNGFKVK